MDGVETVVVAARPDDPADEARVLADVEHALFARPRAQLVVGRYALGRLLGSGAFGSVYEGFDPELERPVAIKLVRRVARTAGDPDARMLREAKLLARLSHPNVVAVHDVGTTDVDPDPERGRGAQIYIVMELVDGTTLREWLTAQPRSPAEILDAFMAAGQGLAAAHAKGIVHRDFKPENVLVGSDGRIRVSDFGVARTSVAVPTLEHAGGSDGMVDASATATGMLVGTPLYMAPEQHLGDVGDARSDQYAFCVALWEALTGTRPFRGSVAELAQAKRAPSLPRPAGLPRAVWRVLVRGLCPDPADRHPDFASALVALQRARRRPQRIATAALVLGGLGLAAWSLGPDASECDTAETIAETLWPASERDAIATALDHAGTVASAPAIHVALEQWVQRWSAEKQAACLVADADAATRVARDACLDRQAHEFSAIVSVLHPAEPAALEVAPRRVAALPELDPCLHDKVPRVAAWSPSHAPTMAEIEAASALVDAGAPGEALARIEPALQLAVAAEAEALHGRALQVRARAQTRLGEPEAAAADIAAALPVAERAGDEILAAEIAVTQVLMVGVLQDRLDAGRALVGAARARLEGAGLQEMLEPRLALIEGRLDLVAGDYAEARARFAALRDMVRARYGERHVMLADIENNIGVAWEGEGDLERAREHYARSVEMIEALLGEDHPSVGGRLLNLAFIELRHGDVSAAEGHIRRALALLDGSAARHVDNVAKGLGLLAVVLLESQRCEEAIPTSAEALQMRRDQYSPRHRKIATHLIDHARGLIRCDQAALALPYLTEAREILGRGDAPPRLLQRSWFNEGWALREIGRLEEAVAAHERALELAEREHGREHIDVAAVLAELARDHRARGELEAARAAAEESVAIYGRGGAELADAAAARSVLAELAVEHDP